MKLGAIAAMPAQGAHSLGQNEPSKHVRCGGSFPRKQPSRPMASSADNILERPIPPPTCI